VVMDTVIENEKHKKVTDPVNISGEIGEIKAAIKTEKSVEIRGALVKLYRLSQEGHKVGSLIDLALEKLTAAIEKESANTSSTTENLNGSPLAETIQSIVSSEHNFSGAGGGGGSSTSAVAGSKANVNNFINPKAENTQTIAVNEHGNLTHPDSHSLTDKAKKLTDVVPDAAVLNKLIVEAENLQKVNLQAALVSGTVQENLEYLKVANEARDELINLKFKKTDEYTHLQAIAIIKNPNANSDAVDAASELIRKTGKSIDELEVNANEKLMEIRNQVITQTYYDNIQGYRDNLDNAYNNGGDIELNKAKLKNFIMMNSPHPIAKQEQVFDNFINEARNKGSFLNGADAKAKLDKAFKDVTSKDCYLALPDNTKDKDMVNKDMVNEYLSKIMFGALYPDGKPALSNETTISKKEFNSIFEDAVEEQTLAVKSLGPSRGAIVGKYIGDFKELVLGAGKGKATNDHHYVDDVLSQRERALTDTMLHGGH
jgi:hypothetical protein